LAEQIYSAAAYAMKPPPRRLPDGLARARTEQFVRGEIER
jgi:myo-inositol-1-phosphate synthase